MEVKINLPNWKFCGNCPFMNSDYEYGSSCNLGYWGDSGEVWMWFNKIDGRSQKLHPECNDPVGWKRNQWSLFEVRPKKCIDDNGR